MENEWPALNRGTPNEKRIIDIHTHVNLDRQSGLPISGITFLQRGERAELLPASRGLAFRHLAPYSLSGLMGGNRRSLLRLKKICANARAWTLTQTWNQSSDLIALERMWEDADA